LLGCIPNHQVESRVDCKGHYYGNWENHNQTVKITYQPTAIRSAHLKFTFKFTEDTSYYNGIHSICTKFSIPRCNTFAKIS